MSLYDDVCEAQQDVTDKSNKYISTCENEAIRFFEWFQSPAQWGRPVQFAEKNSNEWTISPIGRMRPTGNGNQLALQVKLEWPGNVLDTMFAIRKPGNDFEINFLGCNSIMNSSERNDQLQAVKIMLAQKYSHIIIKRINEASLVAS